MPQNVLSYSGQSAMIKNSNELKNLFKRIGYRCWQFKQVLFPVIDQNLWHEAILALPSDWRPHLKKLRPSERAHVLRVYKAVKEDNSLTEKEKERLLILALVHDIGKGITRHSLWFKIAKVIFPVSNAAHCIEGALLLRRLGADRKLIRLVLRHHSTMQNDELLKKFQGFDDRL
ncbi:MAG: hypothetical protein PWR01_2062 [Clostridiales bacterium]|nr:hypothetical protein [Clostridiales bacterium]MDN5280989.1 hypothetical protein [Candidatus Ozemobacter sp.]